VRVVWHGENETHTKVFGGSVIIDYLSGTAPADIEADICIVGAGVAGIAIAHTFIGSSISVCIIEAGGLAGEEKSQALYEGDSVGAVSFDPGVSRMRVFGGSCTLWGGGCIPLSRQDMEPREWVPHSGWPLSYDELQPYYAKARTFCQIDECDFTDGTFLGRLARQPLPLDESKLINQLFARSQVFFGGNYRAQLAQAPNITVLLHANLLELHATANGKAVRQARIGSLDGRQGMVQARQYVLAAGGIENARLLLLSNSVVPQGLGNQHDLVGRYFMDHPSGKMGTVVSDAPYRLTRPYERMPLNCDTSVFPQIGLSDEVQRKHQLLNGRVHPFPVEGPVPKGLHALRSFRAALHPPSRDEGSVLEARLNAALKNGPMRNQTDELSKESIGILALRMGLGAGDIAKAALNKLTDKPTVISKHVELTGFFEQAPNPDSRVTLGDQVDALGQRKICVDWRLTALDRHTYRTAARLFGTELTRTGGGQFQLEPWLLGDDSQPPQVHGTAHHLGTTRMADSPMQGVVDRHCRVFGVDNLHVAGSSVFPTGGWAFPTFTIVALSLRLAENLRSTLTAYASSGHLAELAQVLSARV
jgi:choline dehydrogenase-like flavoprotein